MRETLELLRAGLPDHNIVIRPHPSERFEPWVERYAGCDRFHIMRAGNNLAWIMAAELVLHTSCTTGSEAALMERPVISLVPEGACVSHWYVSNRVNRVARTPHEAADLARRLLVEGEDVFAHGREARERDLSVYFSLDGPFSSHELIARDILGRFEGAIDASYRWRLEQVRVYRESIAESNKNDFDLGMLQSRLDLLEQVTPGFRKPTAQRIHDELFMLEGG